MILSDALSTYFSKPYTIYWYARHSADEALKGEKTLIEIDMCRWGWEDHINRSSEDIRLKTAIQEEEKEKHKAEAGKIKYGMNTGHEHTYSNDYKSWTYSNIHSNLQ